MRRLIAALVLASLRCDPTRRNDSRSRGMEGRQGRLRGVLVYDEQPRPSRPGLVMVPNWMGVNRHAIAKAKRIAGDDYVVLLADVYGKGVARRTTTKPAKALRSACAAPRMAARARGARPSTC